MTACTLRHYINLVESVGAWSDFPIRSFDALYHVGSMNRLRKQKISFEGSGLSVSLHPNVWRYIDGGWVHGDLWRLVKDGNQFVDINAMTQQNREAVIAWAEQKGYLRRAKVGTNGVTGQSALWDRLGGMLPMPDHAFDLALTVYLEDETGIDGVWWDEPLVVAPKTKGGWAPRGVIFVSRLPQWKIERISETEAPDLDLFSKKRRR